MENEITKSRTTPCCHANIWIHTHFESGLPIQIEATHWNGETMLLDVFNNEHVGDIMENLKKLPVESNIKVVISFDYENWVTGESQYRQYYVSKIALA
tara:strand:+ start:25750 stop:26043 length:294 start_codon:yes stop_codon:yes gene_type:complete